ncbi:hypothetical protein [uncultured Alloprevotella sp.]|uniref:hypothetical protein n=1 Tax=uncultured Alloprevotella sp. TaxID=1283315 RepID=UPI00325FCAC1
MMSKAVGTIRVSVNTIRMLLDKIRKRPKRIRKSVDGERESQRRIRKSVDGIRESQRRLSLSWRMISKEREGLNSLLSFFFAPKGQIRRCLLSARWYSDKCKKTHPLKS